MTPSQLQETLDEIVVGLLSDPPSEPPELPFQRQIYPVIAQGVDIPPSSLYSETLLLSIYYGFACSRARHRALVGTFNISVPRRLHYDVGVLASLLRGLETYGGERACQIYPAKWLVEDRREGWNTKAPSSIKGVDLAIVLGTDEVMEDPLSLRVFTEVVGLMNPYESGIILFSNHLLSGYEPVEYKGVQYDYASLGVAGELNLSDTLARI